MFHGDLQQDLTPRRLGDKDEDDDKAGDDMRWTDDVKLHGTGGFLNQGYPKSSILVGFSLINQPFGGTTIYGTPHML